MNALRKIRRTHHVFVKGFYAFLSGWDSRFEGCQRAAEESDSRALSAVVYFNALLAIGIIGNALLAIAYMFPCAAIFLGAFLPDAWEGLGRAIFHAAAFFVAYRIMRYCICKAIKKSQE